jgi:hypothetical protein
MTEKKKTSFNLITKLKEYLKFLEEGFKLLPMKERKNRTNYKSFEKCKL